MSEDISWIFFAPLAKPSSMRRAIPERLAEGEAVVIVEQPISLVGDRGFMPLSRRCLSFGQKGNFWYYRPLHFPERLPGMGKVFKALNDRLIQREIDKLLPGGMDRIVCYDSPTQYPLVKKFRERLSIYLAVDDRTRTVWGDPISGEIEAERHLLGKIDLVVCVSEPLANTLQSRVPKGRTPPIYVLPNGYDERIFEPSVDYPEPSFLTDIPRPRILVAGHVSERIDWNGIAAASRMRPNWTWVFLGPVNSGIVGKIQNLLNSNAIWHPPIPTKEVPAWIQHCEACAVPYSLNNFTNASNPLKAIEYLAMGAPVLSTRIPALQSYGKMINWVEEGNGNSYAQALDKVSLRWFHSGLARSSLDGIEGQSWVVKTKIFRHLVIEALGIKKEISDKN